MTKTKSSLVEEGSVRVDLVGGTLDLAPINAILRDTVTLNLATGLMAQVKLEKTDAPGVEIISHDYNLTKFFPKEVFSENNLYPPLGEENVTFGGMALMARILGRFNINQHLRIELSSGAPTGSGLGGSSAMGITLFKALAKWCEQSFTPLEIITQVKDIEATVLASGPTGYQDYYPALYGGALALIPEWGNVKVEQLYSPALKKFLEKHLFLIYSGETRFSGINNWEVFKAFFDKDSAAMTGLTSLAKNSHEAYQCLKKQDEPGFLKHLKVEGELRAKLFPKIKIASITELEKRLGKEVFTKVCGAGGGGCFLLVHPDPSSDFLKLMDKTLGEMSMRRLPFEIQRPLGA